MLNTDFCRSCDAEDRVRIIDILGKSVKVKNYICSPDGIHYKKKSRNARLQMSVSPTSICLGRCKFCSAKIVGARDKIDVERFAGIMRRLKTLDVVRGVKITGGEPFYDVPLLNEVISVLYEIFGYELEISVSTNGIGLEKLHLIKDLSRLESIHISRHHYDNDVNEEIFGCSDVPSDSALKEIVSSVTFKDIFVFNCMLLKDHINSPEEAHRFLDFAIVVGVPKVGFMTCAPINDYAKAQTIPYETVINDDDPSLLFTRRFYDYEFCHCRDGVYASDNGDVIEFYCRSTVMGEYGYSRGLVYDADDHLRDGFGGEIII